MAYLLVALEDVEFIFVVEVCVDEGLFDLPEDPFDVTETV